LEREKPSQEWGYSVGPGGDPCPKSLWVRVGKYFT